MRVLYKIVKMCKQMKMMMMVVVVVVMIAAYFALISLNGVGSTLEVGLYVSED